MVEIIGIIGALFVGGVVAFLLYRASRTFDVGVHNTFVTTRDGTFYGALRAPTTLWDPRIRVMRDKDAPDLSFITHDPAGAEYFERSLVTKRTGEISLRVNTCAPRPFLVQTADDHKIRVRTRVIFQLDVERIQIACQLQNFGATLAARIENLFENELGQYRDEEVRSKQYEIENSVVRALKAIEEQDASAPFMGLPLGIHVFEASFSYEDVGFSHYGAGAGSEGEKDSGSPPGVMMIQPQQLDKIADAFKDRDPSARELLLSLLEMQTRQNIVELLCKSGGLVAFTAEELGLSTRRIERSGHGFNVMKEMDTPAAPTPAQAPAPATPAPDAANAGPKVVTDAERAARYYGVVHQESR
ncbi:hypothetical protein GC169_03145 [bacterium]|nr:hypothetical protein [bacterium]